MYPRICFIGGMGAGKSGYAKFLSSTYGLHHISIAQPIKAIADELAPLLGIERSNKAAMRPWLQAIGVGPKRTDPAFWARQLVAQHDLMNFSQGVGYVVDDCRSPDEAEMLLAAGFQLIRLEASDETRKARILKRDGVVGESVFLHDTETAIARIRHDEVLTNETEEDLSRNFALLAARMQSHTIPSPDDAYVGEVE